MGMQVCTAHRHWADGGEWELCLPEEEMPFPNLRTGATWATRGLGGEHFRQRKQHKQRH